MPYATLGFSLTGTYYMFVPRKAPVTEVGCLKTLHSIYTALGRILSIILPKSNAKTFFDRLAIIFVLDSAFIRRPKEVASLRLLLRHHLTQRSGPPSREHEG